MKYSDQIAEWLDHLGYTHCFFVGGGNIMHLVDSLSNRLKCIPVIHEVAAGIATEYFNESQYHKKALALVTAGPGLTNIVTAVAGAYLESRELLIIGGQVKTNDLSMNTIRQRGIQEIDGAKILESVTIKSQRIDQPISFESFAKIVSSGAQGRKGPVFIEIPINVQAEQVDYKKMIVTTQLSNNLPLATDEEIVRLSGLIKSAERPIFLIGGGIKRDLYKTLSSDLSKFLIPIATTWNGCDRIDSRDPLYAGRPNTWGQRSANLIIQQSDLVVSLGTRLGLQQTGFNWKEFVPNGRIIQIDIDSAELKKGHPKLLYGICVDANDLLKRLMQQNLGVHDKWLKYVSQIKTDIPLIDPSNQTELGYLSPHTLMKHISEISTSEDAIIPCSSGGAFTVAMQIFEQKYGQIIITNKGLASMGYGLAGAIGVAVAHPEKRVILFEGDGGFAQNIQEIGTAKINNLNIKIFIFDNEGYASIQMTQKNYFSGRYIGCDLSTGLGLPNWKPLLEAWDVPCITLTPESFPGLDFEHMMSQKGLTVFIVKIDPKQTYYPKITSQISEDGSMQSNPLHIMFPDLNSDQMNSVGKYIK